MANTTNFNWETPDDTDLVKDGAAAMRTLGNSIDTSFVDLKGGTTGQILSKTSNTDMDFTWITNDQGDITAVTAGTGITGGGTSGAVTVSFDQANFGGGQFAAGKNKIINGDCAINQRAFTTSTSSGSYLIDRFVGGNSGGTVTYSVQQFTPGAAPVAGYEAKQFMRLVVSGQSAAGDFATVAQEIEDVRTFAGQTVTISFWAKANTGTPGISVDLLQKFGSGGSPSSSVSTAAGKNAITTSWARYSYTVAVPSISGKTIGTTENTSSLRLRVWVSAGSTYNTETTSLGTQANTFDIWGVQVEAGSVATPFQTASGGSPQAELAMCQRYYWQQNSGSAFTQYGMGEATTTSVFRGQIPMPVTMRIVPTSIGFSALEISDYTTGYSSGSFTLDTALSSNSVAAINYTHGSAALTQFRMMFLKSTSSSGYLSVNAEL